MPASENAVRATPMRRLTATLIVVALGITYAAFAAIYLSTRVASAPDAVLGSEATPGGVSVVFIPQRVDPERESVQGVLRVTVDRSAVASDVTVRVFPFLDTTQVQVPADASAFEQDATLSVEGEVRTYPFDRYSGSVQITATATPANTAIPVGGGVLPIDGLTGWSFTVNEGAEGTTGPLTDSLLIARPLTTRVTVMILATLTVALGAIAIALAWSVAVGRKESSFGEATWLAATIFSVISVRNFMPGAPPIGAYLDALAIIPAILALFLSMALLVVFWLMRPAEQDSD